MASRHWIRLVRPQDAVWLLLFSALGVVSGTRSAGVIFLLLCLALLQVLEPKIPALASHSGNVVSILIKLFLGYLLIRFTGDVTSSYYLILLLPVLSAATTLGAAGTALITVLACGSYLSCLLQVDWARDFLPSEGARELSKIPSACGRRRGGRSSRRRRPKRR